MILNHTYFQSLVGRLKLIASADSLVAVLWPNDRLGRIRLPDSLLHDEHPILLTAVDQLNEYFAGSRRTFGLPLSPIGTAFQLSVWKALQTIPYGETCSYGSLADSIGNPKASRAVGAANGRNPISIIVPCHRVIGSSGKLTGFAGGLSVKQRLLDLEKPACNRGGLFYKAIQSRLSLG